MDTTAVILIILLLLVAAGVVVWALTRETQTFPTYPVYPDPTPTIVEEDPAPIEEDPAPVEETPVIEEDPLVGRKFINVKTETGGIITPTDTGNKFEIVTSGERTNRMVIELKSIADEPGFYYLYAPEMKKYLKYSNGGFGTRTSTPTTYHYKIKLSKIGEGYVMSYITNDDVEKFFGFDGVDSMKVEDNVTNLISTGLVTFENPDLSGFVIAGNFGDDAENYTEYGAVDEDEPIDDINGCIDRLGEIDLDEDYRASLLSVSYNKDAEAPCRVYPQSDGYTYNEGATGWVTTCLDKNKSVQQGCLL